MAEDYTLLTPENVELHFDVAGIGSRVVAAIIDYTILVVGYLIVIIGGGTAAALVVPDVGNGSWIDDRVIPYLLGALVILLTFFGWWGYFILFELLWNGQSPGKRILGLRVVRAEGQPVSAVASLVRNLLRVVDLFLGIGIVTMVIDRQSRRLGDFAAGTLVVREPRAESFTSARAFAPVDLPPVDPMRIDELANADRLTMTHYTVIRDFFARRSKLSWGRAQQLARQLAERIALAIGQPSPGQTDPEAFLAAAARAFEARQREA
jgi:uncharacterized RDD family membrane protein YckC